MNKGKLKEILAEFGYSIDAQGYEDGDYEKAIQKILALFEAEKPVVENKPRPLAFGVWITGSGEPDHWLEDGEGNPYYGEQSEALTMAMKLNQASWNFIQYTAQPYPIAVGSVIMENNRFATIKQDGSLCIFAKEYGQPKPISLASFSAADVRLLSVLLELHGPKE